MYDQKNWLVVQYPAGGGGKFVAALMFMFDQVEHWYQIKDPQEQYKFYNDSISKPLPWLIKELNQDWGLNFFSRTYERNNRLSPAEFDVLAQEQGSQHFKQSIDAGQIILDHWHRPVLPEFWKQSLSIVIWPDDLGLLRKLIVKKLLHVDLVNKEVVSLLDDPTQGQSNNRFQRSKFVNQYKFNYTDLDQFLDNFLMSKPWYAPWMQSKQDIQSTWMLNLSDLLDFDKVVNFIEPIQDHFGQTLDKDLIRQFHQSWLKNSFDY